MCSDDWPFHASLKRKGLFGRQDVLSEVLAIQAAIFDTAPRRCGPRPDLRPCPKVVRKQGPPFSEKANVPTYDFC